MNLHSLRPRHLKFMYRIGITIRRLFPKKRSCVFESSNSGNHSKISCIYVINLDRQPDRWSEIKQELKHVLDRTGVELFNLTKRHSAVDAKDFTQTPQKDSNIDPVYTLGDQLYVEPQPLTLPTQLELNSPIRMSRSEVAIARSHIDIWCKVVAGNHEYVLVLEDDVYFQYCFVKHMDEVWFEIERNSGKNGMFDILYLSYEEVKHGAPKTFLSKNVFRPERGLWFLSGYVISRKGAKKLLNLLPCKGPIDLWINHQFKYIDVKAASRSIIKQRRDLSSTNSYSILPSLTKIGAITSEAASLFQVRPSEQPVFVFGTANSGFSSLAMALSMLGYRCCSDLQKLPECEHDRLLSGSSSRIFNAYVNIKSLEEEIKILRKRYQAAKFIFTSCETENTDNYDKMLLEELNGTDYIILHKESSIKWKVICEHLRCVPPSCSFPVIQDIGQRNLLNIAVEEKAILKTQTQRWDNSPWIVEPLKWWNGIHIASGTMKTFKTADIVKYRDSFDILDTERWYLREDTFTDNLALFRPSNVILCGGGGVLLNVRKESLGVREFSAASLTSQDRFLYGRFEASFKASNTSGVVTGFFLHRDSPRQEIDIEITGNRTDRLLVNVFYNPGDEGAKFDYGYRGAANTIDLGFDATESEHLYAIDWSPYEICWYVDGQIVYKRCEWNPTPIPHLPMALHFNIWPTRSKELAGRLTHNRLPSSALLNSIKIEANAVDTNKINTVYHSKTNF